LYSLERLFYSVAALTALATIFIFGLFFNIGDMVAAAFGRPGAFAEWNRRAQLRMALKHSVPEEIRPDESQKPLGQIVYEGKTNTAGFAVAALHAPPRQSLSKRVKKEEARLARQGFTDEAFIRMNALFTIDRSHHGRWVGIDRLISRGNRISALNELEGLIETVDEGNKRAIAQLLQARLKLVLDLEAPPDQIYDSLVQLYEHRLEIARIEVRGYQNVPRFKRELERAAEQVKALEEKISGLKANRAQAFRFLATGIPYGKMSPELRRLMKASIERKAAALPVPEEQKKHYLDLVETFPEYGSGSDDG
jgi:hypothetical protein